MLRESLRERFGERPEVPIRADAVKLLASETRLSILRLLNKRRMTVSELARQLGLNKSTVHEHLAKLVEGGLLLRDASEEREWVYYELTRTGHYVLQPAAARFVLLPGLAAAALVALALLHVFLTAGQGLAIHADEPSAPAGEAHLWALEVARPGLLGLREPARDAQLWLLTPEQAAEFQVAGARPAGARPLGSGEGLREEAPGRFTFRVPLEPGIHYVLAESPGLPAALFPIRAEAVEVVPKSPSVLPGIDPPQVELALRVGGESAGGGFVQALDEGGREVAQAPVLNGRAVLTLAEPVGEVRFRFRPAEPGSVFADANGVLHAPRPHIAFEPAEIPLHVPAEVRVVVDDPSRGPREGAGVALEGPGGGVLAQARTDPSGSAVLRARLTDPGELALRVGKLEAGRVAAKPGLRVWVEPGPHWEGEEVRVRTLLMGAEPQPVGAAVLLLDGREVGVTDGEGWLPLQFGLGGRYELEARREGYVAGSTHLTVLPRTGYVTPSGLRGPGFAGLAAPAAAAGPGVEVQDARVLLGQDTRVRALLANPDPLPRVLRAELREDGRVVEVKGVEAEGGGQAWAEFTYEPREPGLHSVTVNGLPPQRVEALEALSGGGAPERRATPGPEPWLLAGGLALAALALAARRRP